MIESDISAALKAGVTDAELDLVIQEFLTGPYYFGEPVTVAQWRLDHYVILRQWAYPPLGDFNDIQVKLNSGIPELVSEGQAALEEYVQNCLNIKTRFPKE